MAIVAASDDASQLVYIIAVVAFIVIGWVGERFKLAMAGRTEPGIITRIYRRILGNRCPQCGRRMTRRSEGWSTCERCHWHVVDKAKAVAVGLEQLTIHEIDNAKQD